MRVSSLFTRARAVPPGKKTLSESFAELWEKQSSVPDVFAFLEEHAQATAAERAEVLLIDQARRAEAAILLPAEAYLSGFPEIAAAKDLKLRLIEGEFRCLEARGSSPEAEEFAGRFPELGEELLEWLRRAEASTIPNQNRSAETAPRPPSAGIPDDPAPGIPDDPAPGIPDDPAPGPLHTTSEWDIAVGGISEEEHHVCFGRYRVETVLGEGAFGRVYLAHDDQLARQVAIKVPHRHLVHRPEDIETYLREARILARLDHKAIVPVLDFGQTDDGSCYLVEKLIRGSTLAKKTAESRPSHAEAAELVAAVAEALHFVHTHGVFHRDIKPANILVDAAGKPFVTDFGLALVDEDFGKKDRQGGTLAYMSPEQARNEGHLVDGRSDIFSLGVVFYELLTGSLPFQGSTRRQVLERIQGLEARPPRQLDDAIPPELERICLKALSKRRTDRYSTALDMATDLHSFLAPRENGRQEASRAPLEQAPAGSPVVVPKGIRSFDGEDAEFFLELLPGPRDRGGVPESIRFWKTRIEELDADRTFRVGLMYGPSGCGKSSRLKAGLLPRLASHVAVVFVEAGQRETEARLLRGLLKQAPALEGETDLSRALARVRQGRAVPSGRKVLLVLDQFEQWLHGRADLEGSELVRALRHCDGGHLQCVLLVRDDFWMGVTRFLKELEVELVEGKNSAAVDLFDLRHAQKVLTLFGRAFGALPPASQELTRSHTSFVSRAVLDLANEGKVFPVRLALFAEMVKGRAWSPSTLKEVGGAEGIGVKFLEEAFHAPSAPPEHRLHQKAARAVLTALLPEAGSDLKGHMRSREELLRISGHARRPKDFDSLLRILDGELRLLTPVEPLSPDGDAPKAAAGEHYQLTHDYLAPSLREWLIERQKDTRRGRAELRLDLRYSLWKARPERKQLPTSWEWLGILFLTRARLWTAGQRQMMRAAAKMHLTHLGAVLVGLVVLAGLGLGGKAVWQDWRVHQLVKDARAAWRQGPGHWEEACGHLQKAHLADRTHPAVQRLLGEIFNQGALTIQTVPAGLEIEVRPDPGADRELGLEWNPEVPGPSPSKFGVWTMARFRAGERIPLRPGHYRIIILGPIKGKRIDFPHFVTHVRYEQSDQGWSAMPLTHREAAAFNPYQQEDSRSFTLAEEVVMGVASARLVFPDVVPAGFAYVNPGPFWHAPDPRTIEMGKKELGGRDVAFYDGSAGLIHDELEHGFLVAQDETAVGDLKRWFARFGNEFFAWQIGRESYIAEAKDETGMVPLEIHERCWREELERRGCDPKELESPDDIFKRVFADPLAWWDTFWGPTRTLWQESPANDDAMPAGGVNQLLARAYAATHQPIEAEPFKRWLKSRADEANRHASGLEAVLEIVQAEAGDFVDPGRLPGELLVRNHRAEEEPRPLLEGYDYWLKTKTFYGWQLPLARIKAWARSKGWDEERIETSLTEWRWLWEMWDKEKDQGTAGRLKLAGGLRDLVDSYATAILEGEEKPEREHFRKWLGWMIEQERKAGGAFEALLERLEGPEEEARRELETVPFPIRMRYGADLGWNLPTARQWEKACRGPDGRPYPWGDEKDDLNALFSRDKPFPVISARTHGKDRSPHNVYCMAGNLSEWVQEGSYLKGGNYMGGLDLANAAGFLSRPGGKIEPWAGFRVVRELIGPAEVERPLAKPAPLRVGSTQLER